MNGHCQLDEERYVPVLSPFYFCILLQKSAGICGRMSTLQVGLFRWMRMSVRHMWVQSTSTFYFNFSCRRHASRSTKLLPLLKVEDKRLTRQNPCRCDKGSIWDPFQSTTHQEGRSIQDCKYVIGIVGTGKPSGLRAPTNPTQKVCPSKLPQASKTLINYLTNL